MKLGECAVVRTGLVFSRKEAPPGESRHIYRALNLKNVAEDGRILLAEVENYYASEALKEEYFTRGGDVLLRLSAPYTAVLITEKEAGLLVPSHFAIIRTDKAVDPHYLHWRLTKNRKRFYKIASGGAMMGTISSGYIAEMAFEPPEMGQQRKIGELLKLANREQQLLSLLRAKKKQLIDAALKKFINVQGEMTL